MMRPASSGGSVDGTSKITERTKNGSCRSRVATRKDGVDRSVQCAFRDVARVAIRTAHIARMPVVTGPRSLMPNARIHQLIPSFRTEVQRAGRDFKRATAPI